MIKTGKSTRIKVAKTTFRGEKVINVAKQYKSRETGEWLFAKGGFNLGPDEVQDLISELKKVSK